MGYNGGGNRKVRSSMIPLSRLSLSGGNIGLIIMLIIIPIVIVWGLIEVLVSLFDWISEKNSKSANSSTASKNVNSSVVSSTIKSQKEAEAVKLDAVIAQVDSVHNITPQSIDKFAKLEQLLKVDIEPFHNKPIEVGIIETIESTFVFEYQFYFTRVLLSIEEYNTLSLGEVFRSTFPTYKSYVNEWNSIYCGCSALYKINYVFGIILQEYKFLEEKSFYELLMHGVNLVFDDKERLLYDAILGKSYITTDHTAIVQIVSWHWYKMLRVGSIMSGEDITQALANSLIKRQKMVLQDGLNKYNRLYSEQYAVIIDSFYKGEPYNETISSNSVFTTDVYNSLKANGYIVAMGVCVQGYRVDIAIKSRDGKKDIMWVMCETHSFTPDNIALVANKYKVLASANVKIYKLKSSNWSRYRPSEESNLLKAVESAYASDAAN